MSDNVYLRVFRCCINPAEVVLPAKGRPVAPTTNAAYMDDVDAPTEGSVQSPPADEIEIAEITEYQRESPDLLKETPLDRPPPPPYTTTERPAAMGEKIKVKADSVDLNYRIDQIPPWYSLIFLGLQHYLTMFGATIAVPIILSEKLCIKDNPVALGEIISTIFFVSGIVTILQTCIGNRLPIVQGATFAFISPSLAILSLPQFECQDIAQPTMVTNNNGTLNITNTTNWDWDKRGMREIQGAIMISSLFQIVIGFTGAIGFLLRFIGPLTIAPTVALVGLSLYGAAGDFAGHQWGIAALVVVLIIILSQAKHGIKVLQLFPVLIAIGISWGISAIITHFDGWDEGHPARTDRRLEVMTEAKWARVPYPWQWGTPTFSLAGIFGMLAGVIASMIESIGDYYACARLSGAPPPPSHAVNRGIGIEGIGCLLAGAWGSGNGTTSYSENVAALGITKVGSRVVVQVGALLMIILAIVGKCGAVFTLIPDPIVGGLFWSLFGLIVAVGLSNLQFVNLNSTRNLFVLGFSFFTGMVVPTWLANNDVIKTGVVEIDQIFTVLLKTNMAVAGIVAFTLDNILPGTLEDRGITSWRAVGEVSSEELAPITVYDLPLIQSCCLNKIGCCRYVPFMPYHVKTRSSGDIEY